MQKRERSNTAIVIDRFTNSIKGSSNVALQFLLKAFVVILQRLLRAQTQQKTFIFKISDCSEI